MSEKLFNIDDLLNGAFKNRPTLNDLFEQKLAELNLNKTNIQEIFDISYRTLNGILTGSQKVVDVTQLVKIGDFLQLSKEEVFKLYMESVQIKHPTSNASPQKIKFIKDNFDLTALRKAGLINSVTDYEHIEKKIISRLGYKSIYEYKKPGIDVAFSSGLFKPKNLLTRLFWIRAAIGTLEEIDNPHAYSKQDLIKFIPYISWYSLNEERGLVEVIRGLFKVGVTVIYQPPLQGLQLRGATFSVNDKPCIVLSNYMGHYSTLWFCLMHELFHVVFDWNDIKKNSYHLTDDDNEELTVREREDEADSFAREYLFSKEKMEKVKRSLSNVDYIKQIAKENHVHAGIIYAFNAFDNNNDRKLWARATTNSPKVKDVVSSIDYAWDESRPFEEIINEQKQVTYN
ncbi:MAG: ImmA/IrrE family metallo-endopeptidase [Agriterribacter sp.]